MAIEDFGGYKDLQILVIGEDLNWVARSFKVMASMSHTLDNGKKFAIVDILVPLGRGTLVRVESHWVPIVRRSSQTGESTGDRPAFSGLGSSSGYNSYKVTGSRITKVTLSIELI